jgi:hypothetical protein
MVGRRSCQQMPRFEVFFCAWLLCCIECVVPREIGKSFPVMPTHFEADLEITCTSEMMMFQLCVVRTLATDFLFIDRSTLGGPKSRLSTVVAANENSL